MSAIPELPRVPALAGADDLDAFAVTALELGQARQTQPEGVAWCIRAPVEEHPDGSVRASLCRRPVALEIHRGLEGNRRIPIAAVRLGESGGVHDARQTYPVRLLGQREGRSGGVEVRFEVLDEVEAHPCLGEAQHREDARPERGHRRIALSQVRVIGPTVGRGAEHHFGTRQLGEARVDSRHHPLTALSRHIVNAETRLDPVLAGEMGREPQDRVDAAQEDGWHPRNEPLNRPDLGAVSRGVFGEELLVTFEVRLREVEPAGLFERNPVPLLEPEVVIRLVLLAPPGSEVRIAELRGPLLRGAPDVFEPLPRDPLHMASHRGGSIRAGRRASAV